MDNSDRAQVRRLGSRLLSMQQEIDTLRQAQRSPRLPFTTVEDGAVRHRDSDGTLRRVEGRQGDGSFTAVDLAGPPPPAPSAPQVAAFAGGFTVHWDGTFLGGAARPSDWRRVDVHLDLADGFTPTEATVDAGIFVPAGATLRFATGDYVPHRVRLVAVSTSGVWSVPSVQVSVTPLKVGSGDVAPGAVGSTQLSNGAVQPQHLTADLLLASVIRMLNASGVETMRLDGATGSILVSGEYRTANGGERIVINEAGVNALTLRMYGPDGIKHAAMYQVLGSDLLVFRSQENVQGRSGFMFSSPTFAAMSWGAAGTTQFSRVEASQLAAQAWGPVVGIRTDRRFPTDGDGNQHRIGFVVMDTAGSDVANSVLEYRPKAGDEPWLKAPVRDSGLVFGIRSLHVSDAAGGYAPIHASAFNVASSSRVKDRKRPLPWEDPVRKVQAARSSLWQYPHERQRPERPEVILRQHAGLSALEPGELVDVEWPTPAPDPAGVDHVGPMAEDLPPEILTPDGQSVDLRDQVGLMWAAIGQIGDSLDAIGAHLKIKVRPDPPVSPSP